MKKTITFFRPLSASLFALSLLFVFSCSSEEEAVAPSLLDEAGKHNQGSPVERMFTVDINPLNESGVSGTATLILEGNELTVRIQASGLEAGELHPQHIHGFVEDNRKATCPTMEAADTDDDGIISLAEGLPFYGPILQPLYVPIDTYPTAEDGTIDFERTFTLGEVEFDEEGQVISFRDLMPLQNRVIVLHGMTVDGEYNPFLPVACGQIRVQPKGKKHNM